MVTKCCCVNPYVVISVLHVVGPLFVVAPMSINVSHMEDHVVLSCSVTGFPTPSIVWQHNDSLVTETGHVEINETMSFYQRSSTLTVREAMINDTGNYSCKASISSVASYSPVTSEVALVLVQGQQSSQSVAYQKKKCRNKHFYTTTLFSFFLFIAVPEQPQSVMAQNVSSRNLTLIWMEPHKNNAPILGYRVSYTEPCFLGGDNHDVNITGAIEVAFISGLQPGVTYSFTVVAFNDNGGSIPSVPLKIKTLDEGNYNNGLLIETFRQAIG